MSLIVDKYEICLNWIISKCSFLYTYNFLTEFNGFMFIAFYCSKLFSLDLHGITMQGYRKNNPQKTKYDPNALLKNKRKNYKHHWVNV